MKTLGLYIRSHSRTVRTLALAAVVALLLSVALLVPGNCQTPAAPVIPPTDTFNSAFADVQTWATSLVAGPGKYVIYTMLSFIGFGLVVGWIKRATHTR